jgi:hypothetical protein
MRPYILRALLRKECERHLANRGGIALGLLLVASAVMLSAFRPGGGDAGGGTGMVGGVHHCYVEYHADNWLTRRLRDRVPDDLKGQVVFRRWDRETPDGAIVYPPGIGGIHLKTAGDPADPAVVDVTVWHPKDDPHGLQAYETWLWKEARAAFTDRAVNKVRAAGGDPTAVRPPDLGDDDLWTVRESFRQLEREVEAGGAKTAARPAVPAVSVRRAGLGGKVLDVRSAVATGMVVFALYFACVYLLPTLNCEERERGVLLAQALSPASPAEILAAKFLFYPALGGGLAAVLAAIYKPAVVWSLFFWMALFAVAAGFLGIGMTIAALARTQRAAFMGGMCYLLSVALLLIICATNGIPGVPHLAFEYHVPRVLHAALSEEQPKHVHWLHLLAAYGLAACWLTAAGRLFRRRGWQ